MSDTSADASGAWPVTSWTLLRAGQDAASPACVESRNKFLARYWKPVFVFLRAKRHPPQRAEELTQAFFLHVLEKGCFPGVDRRKGKFRTYLLGALCHFLADQTPERLRRQSAFEEGLVPLGSLMTEEERIYEPPAGEPVEVLFMRQWAIDLVHEVRRRVRSVCERRGHAVWYDVFEALHPADPGALPPPSEQELAERLGLSRDQVRYAKEQAEQSFRVLLRTEIREQVGSEEEVGDEIRELMALLGQ
jgi:RNA polymerase sigma-70 factor (ECF subfamily)